MEQSVFIKPSDGLSRDQIDELELTLTNHKSVSRIAIASDNISLIRARYVWLTVQQLRGVRGEEIALLYSAAKLWA